jgi:hypothetical protein
MEETDKNNPLGPEEYLLKRDFQEDLEAHDYYTTDFDAYEAMLVSKVYDSVSKKTTNSITDGQSATLAIERAARVVGQLPTGQVKAAGKRDQGKGALMDIILQRWIYPNANAQRPFLEKLRLWQLYSSVYGYSVMHYDWHTSPNGYIGPDCWLWNARNFIPQNGRTTVEDMDYAHAITYVSPKWLDERLDEPEDAGWDAGVIKEVMATAKQQSREPDANRDTLISRTRSNGGIRQIPIVTRYEAGDDGEWVTFAPDQGYKVLRRIANPHKNGKIPFVVKYSMPLADNFYGLGDFQRNKPIQFAMDGLTNFYFEGIKTNIYPPFVINANGVIKRTVTKGPDAIIQETVPNSVRRLETSTAGLSTYQQAVTQLKGALFSQAGTTDTTLTMGNTNDPAFGRTPAALDQQKARESSRDNQDRFFLESAITCLIEYMLGLIPVIGTESMPIDLFSEDIAAIKAAGFDDVTNMLRYSTSGGSARITINPTALKGCTYRFQLDPGTTSKTDEQAQIQSVMDFLSAMAKFPNALDQMAAAGKVPDFEFIFQMVGNIASVPNVDRFFKAAPPPAPQQPPQPAPKPPNELIDYKDAPPDVQAQMEAAAGFKPSATHSAVMTQAAHSLATPQNPPQAQNPDIQAMIDHLGTPQPTATGVPKMHAHPAVDAAMKKLEAQR